MKKFSVYSFLITVLFFLPGLEASKFKSVRKIKVSSYSGDIVLDGNWMWQVDIISDSINVYDVGTGEKLKSIISPGFSPYSICVHRDTLVVSNDDEIAFINRRGRVFRLIASPTSSVTGITSDKQNLWITGAGGYIYSVNTDDGTVLKTFEGPGGELNGLSYNNGYLWTTSRRRDEIYMMDTDMEEVVNILSSPGPHPSGIHAGDKYIYVTDFEKDSIYVLPIPYDDFLIKGETKKSNISFNWSIRNVSSGLVGRVKVYIAIPEDMKNQKILSTPELDPSPDRILKDRYGQKIAAYTFRNIKPDEAHNVSLSVDAELNSVNFFIVPERVKEIDDIPKNIRDVYLENNERLLINHPIIKEAVREAVKSENNPYWITRKIINYIAASMEYELSGGWDVAPEVLRRGKGSCSEYAYAFISMMRASGIPTRYVGSMVERGDRASIDRVFHRWVEVYLPGYGWVPVDPGVAESSSPRRKALSIGHRPDRYLITTAGGGGSEYLSWSYNYRSEIKNYDPRAYLNIERYAIWEPLD